MKKHYRHENDCLNCGTELNGKYCHQCGQENLQIKESFGHMITHAVSDYFHFDHQFFHTLKPLFFTPGKLTNEYMAGRRVQYLHPVKMYIFISLVYFLVLFSSKDREVIKFDQTSPGDKKETSKGNRKDLEQVIKDIRENSALSAEQKQRAIAAINNQTKITKGKDGKVDTTYTTDDVLITSTKDTSYQQYLSKQQKLAPEKRDGFLARYYNKKAIAWNQRGGTNSKEMIGEAVKHNTPKLMFFLLPMFALMLKMTFNKNKKFYVEHLIFTFHLHCFLFLFLTIIMLIKLALPHNLKSIEDTIETFAVISILIYLFIALKTVYRRSTVRTLTKMFGLMASYSIVFIISFVILVIISAIFTL